MGQESSQTKICFPKQLWYWVKNAVDSAKNYSLLSPNPQVRWQVNQRLRDRPAYSMADWCADCRHHGIHPDIARFACRHLSRYSGLRFARVRLSDRLEADLQWTEVCWFDWELKLCQDVWHSFGIDMTPHLVELVPTTVHDLLLFLQHQVVANGRGSHAGT